MIYAGWGVRVYSVYFFFGVWLSKSFIAKILLLCLIKPLFTGEFISSLSRIASIRIFIFCK